MSVLFCDLVGFTAASEHADPEDVRARIRPYHARMRQEIEGFGGTVEKFVGDAVMSVFGAPVAHEDDVERAVRAGLAILEAIAELNEGDPDLKLQVRVGINTGEAVVALGARPEEGEGIVTGDVVNTAARIQSAAPVGGVAVGEQTHRATERVFEYEPLEPALAKGKAEPLSLWHARAARSRFGTDITRRYTTPLVGRELEKPLLIATFERAAQQRSVQLLTIVGEPGVGKSRLVAELFAYLTAKPELTRWRQGRCLPYGEGITFWALGEIVKAEAGILESDSAEVAAGKLEAAISREEPERPWLLQRLGPLVGVEAATSAERQELFTAWRRFLEGLAAVRPTVLVFEDLHWADEALLAFLEHLSEWAEGVPLLVLCTARPELYERHPGWAGGVRNATTINLPPLSDQETAELVSHLIATTVLSEELKRGVLERAGGNPLYAEEFVRLLADRDLGADRTGLPESLQALIAARLDTLSPERKSLLQDAAVLGKVFWVGALEEIGGRDRSGLEVALHELARKELVRSVRVSSMEGEREYSFWHLLVRDVAYGQIPRAERARRHRSAAAWIERKAGERVEDLAELLAHHYLQALELAEAAGDPDQAEELAAPARRFLTLAGERALGLDGERAEQNLARALTFAPVGHPDRASLLERWAHAAQQQGQGLEAKAALEEAFELFREQGEPLAAGRVLTALVTVLWSLGDPRRVRTIADALDLLETQPPSPEIVDAYAQLAGVHFINGSYVDAIAAADQARQLAAALGLPKPARALGFRGGARAFRGEREGLEDMQEALELSIEQGKSRDAGVLYANLAIARSQYEGPLASVKLSQEGGEFCKRRGIAEFTRAIAVNAARFLADCGRTEEALAEAKRLAETFEASPDVPGLTGVRSVQLRLHAQRGEDGWSVADAEQLALGARRSGIPDVIVLGYAGAALLLLAKHRPDKAKGLLAELEQVSQIRGEPFYIGYLSELVRCAFAVGDVQLAGRLVGDVEARTPLAEHALVACRAQLTEYSGDHAAAEALYAEAAERWQHFGNVPEHAYALLGQGRCLVALTDPAAEQPLREAAELFSSMGYRPALAETETLLEQTIALAS